MPGENPYTQAADAYSSTAAETDQRALEGKILLKAAQKLEDISRRLSEGESVHFTEIAGVLEYNQKLWTVFVGDMADDSHDLPQNIKNNIATLGVFIFNRTKDVMIEASPEKFKVLIDINRNIAAGLMKTPVGMGPGAPNKAMATSPEKKPPARQEATDSLI